MDLRQQLEAACRSDCFVSVAALREIVNEKAISQYLQTNCSYPDHRIYPEPELILRQALKMFAVLVKCDLNQYLSSLDMIEMADKNFPIDDTSNIPIESEHDLKKIWECQWVIAPFWKTDVLLEIPKHLKICLDDLFDQQPRPRVDQGTFGVIDQIKIKEGHVENYGPDQLFAKKVIRVQKGTEHREADVLLRRKHPHIVPVVVTYTRHWQSSKTAEPGDEKELVIITPWYSTSLRQFIDTNSRPATVENHTSYRGQLYEYVYQILQGLAYLHAPQEDQAWTSHHDLKPENILIDTGRVAITDFGMSHLKPIAEGSGVTASRVLGTSEYAPPEAFNESGGRAKKQHGRAFDMWSMGCIMMEIAVIIYYGYDDETKNIKAFRMDREELPVERRPFPMHETNAKSFYNSIHVIDDWLKTMQSEEIAEERDNDQFSRYLRIMIGMLRGKPGTRLLSWEAVLEFYDLLHPGAPDTERYLRGKELVQKPGKSNLTKTPLHRVAESGDFIWVLCLTDAGWSDDKKDDEMKTPSDLAKEKGHVGIEHYLRHKIAQAEVPTTSIPDLDFIHEVENNEHGLQMNRMESTTSPPPLPDIWPPRMRGLETTEVFIPKAASLILEYFATSPWPRSLYLYNPPPSKGWLHSACLILAHYWKLTNNVITFDYDSIIFPHGALMTALQRLCGRLRGSSRPITLMILRLKHDHFYDKYLDDVHSIMEASDGPLSKVLVTIEHNSHSDDDIDVSIYSQFSKYWDIRRLEGRPAKSAKFTQMDEEFYHNPWS